MRRSRRKCSSTACISSGLSAALPPSPRASLRRALTSARPSVVSWLTSSLSRRCPSRVTGTASWLLITAAVDIAVSPLVGGRKSIDQERHADDGPAPPSVEGEDTNGARADGVFPSP